MSSSQSDKNGISPTKTYSFKNDIVDTWFHLLEKSSKLKLPKIRHPDEVGTLGDSNYCKYHRMLGHPTKNCYFLKDILLTLVDAGVFKLRPEQMTVTTNATSFIRFGQFLPIPSTVNPIPKVELWIININLHQCQKKRLVPVPTPDVGIMWCT